MRTAPLLLLLAACLEPRDLAVSEDQVRIPLGAGVDVAVVSDGVEIERLDWFAMEVDDPDVASAALDRDGRYVRITARGEGDTIVRIRYRATELAVATEVGPAEIVVVAIEPAGVATEVGAMVPIRATAVDTTSTLLDVTASVAWTIDDPAIAQLEGDQVRAMSTGSTTLHATIDGKATTAVISVAP